MNREDALNLGAIVLGAAIGFAIGAYFGEDILRFVLESLHVIEIVGV